MNQVLSLGKVLTLLFVSFLVVLGGVLYLDAPTNIILILAGMSVIILSMIWGIKWQAIEDDLMETLKSMFKPILILLAVGMLTGSWMLSGTIPLIIYYGLLSIDPLFFLVITAIICAVMSVMAGTSWGTIGTVGVALMGVSIGLGIPVEYTAGSIVVGAFFGDKLSPLSDTTVMASAMADVNIIDHIKHMLWTTIPGFVISLVLYFILGIQYGGGTEQQENINMIVNTLQENFNLNPILIIPPFIILTLIYFKKPTLPAFAAGIIAGVLLAIIFQGSTLLEFINVLENGYISSTDIPLVDEILQRGGLASMLGTVSLLIGAAIFGSPLKTAGVISTLLDKIMHAAKNSKTIMTSTLGLHGLLFTITGSYYVTYAVLGPIISPLYDKYKLYRKNWSRTMEDTGTTLSPMIPWGVTGAFIVDTLEVSTGEFILYAPMTYLGIIFALIYIYTGVGVPKKKSQDGESVKADVKVN
ncbi:Na+:H+ antiporter, NhaC family [Lentibacillus halodurans]|uniref:Na+:H+ antiporter, NhaC family n=1 Tax=Lentibacillus halodurans TaxID=237679 RepID=A0A1I0XMJ2_9BACI|nr:Na+/H+ antiporter NhaC [Lentibacillus halodurans]SFB02182.1 Na+:H+ antiporter, NhaC family [Lentibacillus halodurans]